MSFTLLTVPCLSDNYVYLVHDPASDRTAVVDVPDADAVIEAAAAKGWTITDIWITHHHHDHVGGVDALRKATGARVSGAKADDHRLPNLDHAVAPQDLFLFAETPVHVIDVPGHTVGHIAYHLPDEALAFTGDSLMGLGCGRLFEGSPEQMWDSLSRLATLPEDTTICSGHEYSQANARFALTIDPENPDLQARAHEIDEKRKKNQPTVPVLLGEEIRTNPFLRASLPALKAGLDMAGASDEEVFAEIRRRKDIF